MFIIVRSADMSGTLQCRSWTCTLIRLPDKCCAIKYFFICNIWDVLTPTLKIWLYVLIYGGYRFKSLLHGVMTLAMLMIVANMSSKSNQINVHAIDLNYILRSLNRCNSLPWTMLWVKWQFKTNKKSIYCGFFGLFTDIFFLKYIFNVWEANGFTSRYLNDKKIFPWLFT